MEGFAAARAPRHDSLGHQKYYTKNIYKLCEKREPYVVGNAMPSICAFELLETKADTLATAKTTATTMHMHNACVC